MQIPRQLLHASHTCFRCVFSQNAQRSILTCFMANKLKRAEIRRPLIITMREYMTPTHVYNRLGVRRPHTVHRFRILEHPDETSLDLHFRERTPGVSCSEEINCRFDVRSRCRAQLKPIEAWVRRRWASLVPAQIRDGSAETIEGGARIVRTLSTVGYAFLINSSWNS